LTMSVSYVSRHQKYFFKNKKTPEPRSRPVGPRFEPAIVELPCAAPLLRPGCVSPLSHPGRVALLCCAQAAHATHLLLGCATSPTPPSDKARTIAPPPRKRRGRELMGLEPHTCYLHVPPPACAASSRRWLEKTDSKVADKEGWCRHCAPPRRPRRSGCCDVRRGDRRVVA
jgi:hypothetical protein